VDQSQIRAMIVGRQFLDRAEMLGEEGTETSRMTAVVLADLAVEITAKAAVRYEQLPRRARLERDPPLPEVLSALTAFWQGRAQTQDDVPEIRAARGLHDLRNSVQHRGLAPSNDQVTGARVDARRFVGWIASEWFGVPLEEVSRAQLIEDETVRDLVIDAERLAANDDYSQAAERLAVAFEMGRRSLRVVMRRGQYQPRPVSVVDVGPALAELRGGVRNSFIRNPPKLDHLLRGLAHQLDRVSDQVEALTLGARLSDYAWFKRVFPDVGSVMRAGTSELFARPPHRPITSAEYLRGLDFVTTSVLHWQEFAPRLVEPEGDAPDE
jgi:hypothetical protein